MLKLDAKYSETVSPTNVQLKCVWNCTESLQSASCILKLIEQAHNIPDP